MASATDLNISPTHWKSNLSSVTNRGAALNPRHAIAGVNFDVAD